MPQLDIKPGDRLICNHPLTKGEVVVDQYPSYDGKGNPCWDWVLINGNQLTHVAYLQPATPLKKTEIGEQSPLLPPASCPLPKDSDKWYTPPQITELVAAALGAIDLDPCADEGKHIPAAAHYTALDDGLAREWHGRVFINPPYSCPGKWVAKLQAEVDSGRVTEAIALVPAATDTNWFHPYLKSQPLCFWKGRIKFLDTTYKPKETARQSHCLLYWGANEQKFKRVFDEVGTVKNVVEQEELAREKVKPGLYVVDRQQSLGIIRQNLGFGFTVYWISPDKEITYNWERDSEIIERLAIAPQSLIPQPPNLGQAFESYSSRPATTEDLAILKSGDWIKAKDSPWCYKFKRWDGDTCVGVWEGKEFLIPQHLVNVCTMIDGRVVEKFKTVKPGDSLPTAKPSENLPVVKRDDTAFQKLVEELDQGFKNLGSGESMTFKFPQTEAIAAQIAQLQEQLSQLSATLKPYKEFEDKANALLEEVNALAATMRDKGVGEKSLLEWANKLYFQATGAQPEKSEAEKLRQENARLQKQIELLRQDNRGFLERIQQLDGQQTPALKVGDTVRTQEGDEGPIVDFAYGNPVVRLANGDFNLPAAQLTLVISEAAIKEFVAKIKTKKEAGVIAWEDVREVCKSKFELLEQIPKAATTPTQKAWVNTLPELIAGYIKRTDDKADLTWVGVDLHSKVMEVLNANKDE